MQSAKKPSHEEVRLQSLHALNILDTLPEKDFDEITHLASMICNTPIALISLIDKDRQWFKSTVGLNISETSRDLAFCAHAILQNDVFIVPDSTEDERFADNPLVIGEPHIQFYAGAPLLSPDGQTIGTVCVIDSQQRTLNEEQLRALRGLSNQVTRLLELKIQIEKFKATEKRLILKATAVDSVTEGIILQDSEGKILDFNPAALTVLGLPAEELGRRTSMDPQWRVTDENGTLVPGEYHPPMRCLKTGQPQTNVIMGVTRSPNDLRWLQINSVPVSIETEKKPSYVVTSFADITQLKKLQLEQRALEAQLSESTRLSALAEMANGIAHEINNPLAIIKGKSTILKRRMDKVSASTIFSQSNDFNPEQSMKDCDVITHAVDRIAKIVSGLRAYSRNADHDPLETVSLYKLIDETLELRRSRLKNNSIDVRVFCDPSLKVQCRIAQISQIITHLVKNSFDAILNLPTKWIEIRASVKDSCVEIIFSDSGLGIAPHVAQKMMEPFFTTKEVGKGQGLGLSVAKGIAQSHHGDLIFLEDSIHTTFVLKLPLIQPLEKAA